MVLRLIVVWFIFGLISMLAPVVSVTVKAVKCDKVDELDEFFEKNPLYRAGKNFIEAKGYWVVFISLSIEAVAWPYYSPQIMELCNEAREYCELK